MTVTVAAWKRKALQLQVAEEIGTFLEPWEATVSGPKSTKTPQLQGLRQ
jgi:hypothetical protein